MTANLNRRRAQSSIGNQLRRYSWKKWLRARINECLVQHVDSIRANFPEFRLTAYGRDWAIWEGVLKPAHQTYNVQVLYFPMEELGKYKITNAPQIHITSPELRRLGSGEPIPHLYRHPYRGAHPSLCLYDPHDDEWFHDDPIGDTILPWTAEWLFHYEIWRMTGKWGGAEAPHPMPAHGIPGIAPVSQPEKNDTVPIEQKPSIKAIEFIEYEPVVTVLGWALEWMGAIPSVNEIKSLDFSHLKYEETPERKVAKYVSLPSKSTGKLRKAILSLLPFLGGTPIDTFLSRCELIPQWCALELPRLVKKLLGFRWIFRHRP